MQLKTTMQKFWDSIPEIKELHVDIEMPIGSGLKLQAVAETPTGSTRVMAPNIMDIMMVLRNYESASPWNRMKVSMLSRDKIKVETYFDDELRVQTLERIS